MEMEKQISLVIFPRCFGSGKKYPPFKDFCTHSSCKIIIGRTFFKSISSTHEIILVTLLANCKEYWQCTQHRSFCGVVDFRSTDYTKEIHNKIRPPAGRLQDVNTHEIAPYIKCANCTNISTALLYDYLHVNSLNKHVP